MPTPILFVDHAPGIGGAEQSLLLLLAHLDRQKWTPHLAGTPGPLLERAAANGIPVHPLPLPRLRRSAQLPQDWLAGGQALAGLARQLDARLIQANTVRAALYAAPAARLTQRPFLWHMRDFWLSEAKPAAIWADTLGKRLLCAAAGQVVANSHAVAAHLPCPARVTVVHNGLALAQFDPAQDGRPFRQQYAIPLDAPLVGMVGRLRPWKGQHRFLHLAARLRATHPTTHFVLVGGSPFGQQDDYPQTLRRLTEELGLNGRVTFTDHLHDVRPALAALDLFVHPGDPEPFGLVNVEAMAMGKPVVAWGHGALPEIVLVGETGLLVTPEDLPGLATAVGRLLDDPALARRMGQAGRVRAQTAFDIHRVAAEMDAILAQMTRLGI